MKLKMSQFKHISVNLPTAPVQPTRVNVWRFHSGFSCASGLTGALGTINSVCHLAIEIFTNLNSLI
jgi:hypothetical protein